MEMIIYATEVKNCTKSIDSQGVSKDGFLFYQRVLKILRFK